MNMNSMHLIAPRSSLLGSRSFIYHNNNNDDNENNDNDNDNEKTKQKKQKNCAGGYLIARPEKLVQALSAPLMPALASAESRVGLHVRTIHPDKTLCFPDSTPPTAEAVDAAFGNNECMKKAFDHHRFKLTPKSKFAGNAECPRVNLADRFPLSSWFECTLRIELKLDPDAPSSPLADGSSPSRALFFATDGPALHRYAEARLSSMGLLSFSGSDDIGHTHFKNDEEQTGEKHRRRVFLRGAADWYLFSLMDVILAPVDSTFSKSVCIAIAEPRKCAILSPRWDEFAMTGPGVCALRQCFPRALDCKRCKFKGAYMGDPIWRNDSQS
mmetsp:Transcript_30631/g.76674  ORF Transcript_30631/g.76674 Transcript_30631/m.76674 type:complete len:327 (-) Transcript_30631:65-1045(-)